MTKNHQKRPKIDQKRQKPQKRSFLGFWDPKKGQKGSKRVKNRGFEVKNTQKGRRHAFTDKYYT